MLYFAYGSNMDWDQMRERCHSATYVCKARLQDYKLAFTHQSEKTWKCSVADVVPQTGQFVWGVVYNIAEKDIGKLDHCEGYRSDRESYLNSYDRKGITVFEDGDKNCPLTVCTYIVNMNKKECYNPSREYLNIMIKGDEFWKLPESYIDELKKIKVSKGNESEE